ncbi:MAG: cytochrome b6-f complex subunit 6 [Cyanobacteria bacterium RM1_2_2]|nr:cytochrome b6-f complex subunit 6 [Cyanobacteria bacterium RM1_2_2]
MGGAILYIAWVGGAFVLAMGLYFGFRAAKLI